MHGGVKGSGAPQGNKNALKHGAHTREALERRAQMCAPRIERPERTAQRGLGKAFGFYESPAARPDRDAMPLQLRFEQKTSRLSTLSISIASLGAGLAFSHLEIVSTVPQTAAPSQASALPSVSPKLTPSRPAMLGARSSTSMEGSTVDLGIPGPKASNSPSGR